MSTARSGRQTASRSLLANLGVHEELFVVPVAGGKPRQLTDGKHNLGAWSRSGDRFAFTISDSTSAGEVFTMSAGDAAPNRSRASSTT